MVPDEGKEPVIRDVEKGELGRIPHFVCLFLGPFLILVLALFLFGWVLSGFLAVLSSYHYYLGGGPDIVLQCGILICPPI